MTDRDPSQPYAPGDLVELRSGGPPMVVAGVTEGDGDGQWIATVAWFDVLDLPKRDSSYGQVVRGGDLHSAEIDAACLRSVEGDDQ
jgi:uncharacterized protein YodC (DUF2158 family)